MRLIIQTKSDAKMTVSVGTTLTVNVIDPNIKVHLEGNTLIIGELPAASLHNLACRCVTAHPGNKIAAIKMFRDETHMSLYDSKHAIDLVWI